MVRGGNDDDTFRNPMLAYLDRSGDVRRRNARTRLPHKADRLVAIIRTTSDGFFIRWAEHRDWKRRKVNADRRMGTVQPRRLGDRDYRSPKTW